MKYRLFLVGLLFFATHAFAAELSFRSGTGHMTSKYSNALHNLPFYSGVTFASPEPIGFGKQPQLYPELEVGIWSANNDGAQTFTYASEASLDDTYGAYHLPSGFIGMNEWLRVVFSGRAVGERAAHAVWLDLGLGVGWEQVWTKNSSYTSSGSKSRAEVFGRVNFKTSAQNSLYVEGKYLGGNGNAGNLDWLVLAGYRIRIS